MATSLKSYERQIEIPELKFNYTFSSPVTTHVDYDPVSNQYKAYLNTLFGKPKVNLPKIKKVIFNDPATIVIWRDNTKTVVKAGDELFDPEKGLAMAISKKALGNEGNYFNEFKKWLPEDYDGVSSRDDGALTRFLMASAMFREITEKDAVCEKAYNALVNDQDTDAAVGFLGEILKD